MYAHIAEIIGKVPMIQPSAEKLRSMIDVVDQHLLMLKRFDIVTDHWSPIVCVLLLGKLDVDTRNQWESKDTPPTMPDLQALFVYLEHLLTKRRVISATAKIYDPTGLVLPVIVVGKIVQQDIWRSAITWDEPLPADLIDKGHKYQHAIAQLSKIAIQRWLRIRPCDQVELYVFTDASQQALGAVAYFRVVCVTLVAWANMAVWS